MAKTLLNLQDVHVRRGMNTVLEGCSLQVDSGQTVVLTGANGIGKSTLLEAAAGLLPSKRDGCPRGSGGRRCRRSTSRITLTVGMVLQRHGGW